MSFTANIDEIVEENRNHLLSAAPSWPRIRLKEVANILNGFPFESRKFRKDHGMPLLRIRDVVRGTTETFYDGDYDSIFIVNPGDLVVGMDGDFNCARWRGEPALLNQRVCKITADSSCYESKFLEHVLPGYLLAINANTPSVTVKHLSSRTLAEIPLPQPPLEEQQRIVAEIEKQFTRLEAGVVSLKRVQAALKRYRAAVLKAACDGRLVAIEAELARKENRSYESADVLLQRILKERRDQQNGRPKPLTGPDREGIPSLPEGWAVASLDQLSSHITSGSRDWSQYYNKGTGTFILAQNVRPMHLDLSEKQSVDAPKGDAETLRTRVQNHDLLVTIVGARTGDVCRVPRELREHYVCQSVAMLRPVAPACARFMEIFLASPENGQRLWKRYLYGQGRPHLSFEQLRMTPIPLPPLAEQIRIVVELERRLSVIEELHSMVAADDQRAIGLRGSILQKAFSGNLICAGIEKSKPLAPKAKRHFLRVLLSAEIVHQLHEEPTFGQTKHQKIFHLCEHIAQLSDLQVEYHREAAGPYDNRVIHSNAAELKRLNWYEEYPRKGIGRAYRPLPKAGAHAKYLTQYWPEKLETINRLIALMRTWKTDRCEIFSTVYAAWNDLIIWDRPVTDESIMHEILNCWHSSKRSIEEKRWRAAICWMRERGYAPTGFGKPTQKMP
jgi:type I restriction enzyme, S subunit